MVILFGAGASVALIRSLARRHPGGTRQQGVSMALLGTIVSTSPAQAGLAAPAAFGLWPLFLFFFKVGAVLFGSGYVLLAFLRADLVERWHWLAVVTAQLGVAAIIDPTTAVLALASGVLLIRYQVNSAWLVLGGALVGIIAYAVVRAG
jgi:hypothetical protein